MLTNSANLSQIASAI